MESKSLNGIWELEYNGFKQTVCVPCAVETVMEDRSFSGPFFYKKIFELEEIQKETSCVLKMEGVSYACRIFCNGKEAGSHEGIWDTFLVDLTESVVPGKNELLAEVYKPDFDKESPFYFRSVLFGFIPDIMLPFGGIWKDVTLLLRGKNYLEKVQVLFDSEDSRIRLLTKLHRSPADETELRIKVSTPNGETFSLRKPWAEEIDIPVSEPAFWSPDAPSLYQVTAELLEQKEAADMFSRRGGFRKISIRDGEMLLNGEPFYMRGILHWGCDLKRMAPCPSREEVREELQKIREMGFNTVKHCLYFPTEDYYELCDEMGIVTWQEMPLWLPYPNRWMEERIYDQYPKFLERFLHHPSVTLVSLGCELDATIGSGILKDLYRMVKERDSQLIICDNSGSGECFEGAKETDSDIYDYHFYGELYQMESLIQEFTRSSRKEKPWLFGEYNDADTFRLIGEEETWWTDPDEKVNLLRRVHKGFDSDQPVYWQKEILREYGITDQVSGLEELSVCQMQEVRKFLLELTRSYEKIKGYNITAIQDVPITTAGLLDTWGRPKLSEEFLKKINGDVVIALQKDLKRVWDRGADRFCYGDLQNCFSGEKFQGTAVVSNRSGRNLEGTAFVRLTADDGVFYEDSFPCRIEKAHTQEIQRLVVPLPETDRAIRCQLSMEIKTDMETVCNDWDIWVYPRVTGGRLYLWDHSGSFRGIEEFFDVSRIQNRKDLDTIPAGEVLLTTEYDPDMESLLWRGIHVIAIVRQNGVFPAAERPFFREGVKKILPHPVTDSLAHKGFAGIQFYGLASKLCLDPIQMEKDAVRYRPLIRRVDARKFMAEDYLAELTVGEGHLFVTTLNLDGGVGDQPIWFAKNRLAVWLLDRILAYLWGDEG